MSKVIIATHSGSHHADEVFAVAVLMELNPFATVVRTRDQEVIAASTYAVDVGGVWDPARGRFDHHQKGFDGRRKNGVAYASSGLVWAEHGTALVAHLFPNLSAAKHALVAKMVDETLVQAIDQVDTGESSIAPGYFGLSAQVSAYNTTRIEESYLKEKYPDETRRAKMSAELKLRQFSAATAMVGETLRRVVAQLVDELESERLVRASKTYFDGQVLMLTEPGLSWISVVCREMPNVLFVLYPDSTDKQVQIRTVPVSPESFQARKDLPLAWAGLRDSALAEASGVPDAVFCPNGRFIGGALSQSGAMRMAGLALAAS